uniref:Uncharacterized protein n=1 Tax=Rhizophora mucronata TaxID=61149 RepID=A0A2P2NCI7_RHIMU
MIRSHKEFFVSNAYYAQAG